MSIGRNTSRERETGALHPPRMAGSATHDWLANMILGVKTIAAGAEFIPVPYIRAAFSTVVIFLETVDKMKKNRDDLLDLCESIVEIVHLLEAEVSAHGHVAGVRFIGLCEDFIAFLRILQTGLEKIVRSRAGFRGRFKEFLRATTVADQLERYRNRVNELRSNFLLVATIDTNLSVARIQNSVTSAQEDSPMGHFHQFRRIALGEINLLYETGMSNKVHKVKVFTARISGETSLMTVAKYEDRNERWKSDLEFYSRLRHPNVWQLFGFAAAPGLHALIYHDELIPLKIYRQFHRPLSDLVWVCLEGMLFKQFRDASQYHYWSTDANDGKSLQAEICVKRNPVQLCLTMPLTGNDSEDDETEDTILSSWHTELFTHHNPTADIGIVSNILTSRSPESSLSSTLARHIDWRNFFAALVPVRHSNWGGWNIERFEQPFLGSAVSNRRHGNVPIAYIPYSSRVLTPNWELHLLPSVYSDADINISNRFTFSSGSFKALELPRDRVLLSASIELEEETINALSTIWLSQAYFCIRESIPEGEPRCQCGVVDKLWCAVVTDVEFHHPLREEGTLQEAHIFVPPIGVKHLGPRTGLGFSESDRVYWSLDPTGNNRMTQDECDSLGLPRLQFRFFSTARFWHEYHYEAIREFFEAKGFDPYSQDVTRLLGLPLAELEPMAPIVPCVC